MPSLHAAITESESCDHVWLCHFHNFMAETIADEAVMQRALLALDGIVFSPSLSSNPTSPCISLALAGCRSGKG